MTHSTLPKLSPSVALGMGGMPYRKPTKIEELNKGSTEKILLSNVIPISLSSQSTATYIGPIIFDGSKIYFGYSGFIPGTAIWKSYIFSATVNDDLTLSDLANTFFSNGSNPYGGHASGGESGVYCRRFTLPSGKMLVNVGYGKHRQLYDLSAKTVDDPVSVKGTGTYSNGTTWNTNFSYYDEAGLTYLTESGLYIWPMKDERNITGIQIIDPETNSLVKASTSGVTTTNANNKAITLKTSVGYMVVSVFSTSSGGELAVDSYDESFDYIGGTQELMKIKAYGGSKEVKLYAAIVSDEALCVFLIEAVSNNISMLSLDVTAGVATASGRTQVTVGESSISLALDTWQSRYLLPASAYKAIDFHLFDDFICNLADSNNMTQNFGVDIANNTRYGSTALITPKITASNIQGGRALYSATIEAGMIGRDNKSAGQLYDYGDFAFNLTASGQSGLLTVMRRGVK